MGVTAENTCLVVHGELCGDNGNLWGDNGRLWVTVESGGVTRESCWGDS